MIRPDSQYDDDLVHRWDVLIDWCVRERMEGSFFVDRLREMGAISVLDAACGTGFHSVRLATAGFQVVATDGSPAMVRRARRTCLGHGVDVRVLQADWRTLSDVIDERFDAVIVLGNSFTHLLAAEDRLHALDEFRRVLRPGGLLILDSRNYDQMLDAAVAAGNPYFMSTSPVSCRPIIVTPELIRFQYCFPDGVCRELDAYPNRREDMIDLFEASGFTAVAVFDDFVASSSCREGSFIVYCAFSEIVRPR